MEIEWTEAALTDMAALDKGIARRVKQSVEPSPKPALATSRACKVSSRPTASVSAAAAKPTAKTPKTAVIHWAPPRAGLAHAFSPRPKACVRFSAPPYACLPPSGFQRLIVGLSQAMVGV